MKECYLQNSTYQITEPTEKAEIKMGWGGAFIVLKKIYFLNYARAIALEFRNLLNKIKNTDFFEYLIFI